MKEKSQRGFCAARIRRVKKFMREAKEAGDRETALHQQGGVAPATEIGQYSLEALRQRVINRLYPEEPKV